MEAEEARLDFGGERPAQPPIGRDYDAAAATAGKLSVSGSETSEGYQLYLEEVVLGLISSSFNKKVFMGEIVYALTGKRRVASDLYEDIRGEVDAIKSAGKIKYAGKANFCLPGNSLRRRKPTARQQEELERKMLRAFGGPAKTVKNRRHKPGKPHKNRSNKDVKRPFR